MPSVESHSQRLTGAIDKSAELSDSIEAYFILYLVYVAVLMPSVTLHSERLMYLALLMPSVT